MSTVRNIALKDISIEIKKQLKGNLLKHTDNKETWNVTPQTIIEDKLITKLNKELDIHKLNKQK